MMGRDQSNRSPNIDDVSGDMSSQVDIHDAGQQEKEQYSSTMELPNYTLRTGFCNSASAPISPVNWNSCQPRASSVPITDVSKPPVFFESRPQLISHSPYPAASVINARISQTNYINTHQRAQGQTLYDFSGHIPSIIIDPLTARDSFGHCHTPPFSITQFSPSQLNVPSNGNKLRTNSDSALYEGQRSGIHHFEKSSNFKMESRSPSLSSERLHFEDIRITDSPEDSMDVNSPYYSGSQIVSHSPSTNAHVATKADPKNEISSASRQKMIKDEKLDDEVVNLKFTGQNYNTVKGSVAEKQNVPFIWKFQSNKTSLCQSPKSFWIRRHSDSVLPAEPENLTTKTSTHQRSHSTGENREQNPTPGAPEKADCNSLSAKRMKLKKKFLKRYQLQSEENAMSVENDDVFSPSPGSFTYKTFSFSPERIYRFQQSVDLAQHKLQEDISTHEGFSPKVSSKSESDENKFVTLQEAPTTSTTDDQSSGLVMPTICEHSQPVSSSKPLPYETRIDNDQTTYTSLSSPGSLHFPSQQLLGSAVVQESRLTQMPIEVKTESIPFEAYSENVFQQSHSNILKRTDTAKVVYCPFNEKVQEQRYQQDTKHQSFVCPVCAQMFPSFNYLANHMVNHLPSETITKGPGDSNKIHICKVCNKTFSRSDMLTRHMRLHTGLRPYECRLCGQVFSRSDHLNTHTRTHTGEKPYRCPQCPYAAPRRDMITRHMRIHMKQKRGRRNSSTGSADTLQSSFSSQESSDLDPQKHLHNVSLSTSESYEPSHVDKFGTKESSVSITEYDTKLKSRVPDDWYYKNVSSLESTCSSIPSTPSFTDTCTTAGGLFSAHWADLPKKRSWSATCLERESEAGKESLSSGSYSLEESVSLSSVELYKPLYSKESHSKTDIDAATALNQTSSSQYHSSEMHKQLPPTCEGNTSVMSESQLENTSHTYKSNSTTSL